MRTPRLLPLAVAAVSIAAPATLAAEGFDAERAMADVEALVAMGPRSVGSPGHARAQAYLAERLRETGLELVEDAFEATTPLGPMAMKNLIAIRRGDPDRWIVFAGHYDTKRFDDIVFVGANDGGSSAALVVELARAVAARKTPPKSTVAFVLFDGEEALVRWTDRDSLYGSRHLAARFAADGTLARLRALLLVDMIGDRELGIMKEGYSTRWLQDLVWEEAERLGYGASFLDDGHPVEDDHVPFLRRGAPAVDLIDFDYGPSNAYWHTAEDTVDKLSPTSLLVVGRTLLAVLDRLDAMP